MPRVYRMRRRPFSEVLKRAENIEARAKQPQDCDDPSWMRRRAKSMQIWASRRVKGYERKVEERSKARREYRASEKKRKKRGRS